MSMRSWIVKYTVSTDSAKQRKDTKKLVRVKDALATI